MRVIWGGGGEDVCFDRPEQLIFAYDGQDVDEAFSRIEQALRDGRHVAGFATYELGARFVPRQPAPVSDGLPLMAFGVYDAPRVVRREPHGRYALGPLMPLVSRSRYGRDVAAILGAICAGDVYQVNYSVRFTFELQGDPYALFRDLTEGRPYPYAAYVETSTHALVSCSPELFMRLTPGQLTIKPMKGTWEPGPLAVEPGSKDHAEHIMIVDLLRNDLHRLGAVVTAEPLCEIEAYPHFATMTSTIAADLRPDTSLRTVLEAIFPCGSVTGAPKVAAMQLIAATEARRRGIFCGTIGYMGPDGVGCWNVAIRTATIDKHSGRGQLDVGGGIVADSTAPAEWAEILTKRRFFANLVPRIALLETILRAPDGSYRHLDLHLERMGSSADELHFPFDEHAIRKALAEAVAGPDIVRVTLRDDGTVEVRSRALGAPVLPVQVCWARARLQSDDPFLRHKTTWRPAHDAAALDAERQHCFDALLMNERAEACEGARTTLFVERDGRLLTPPRSSGVLPGVLRRTLLDAGLAREGALTRRDVETASRIYVGNSARGLLPAVLRP